MAYLLLLSLRFATIYDKFRLMMAAPVYANQRTKNSNVASRFGTRHGQNASTPAPVKQPAEESCACVARQS
jgi:hypothetical protein